MKKEITIIVVALLIILLGAWFLNRPKAPGMYATFAQCISQSGAKFYGAFWCPHCKAQKEQFGDAVSYLPYIECSNPDGQSQNATCNNAGVSEYPTWVFADGSRESGTLSMEELSRKTGCVLPAGSTIASSTDQGGASQVQTGTSVRGATSTPSVTTTPTAI